MRVLRRDGAAIMRVISAVAAVFISFALELHAADAQGKPGAGTPAMHDRVRFGDSTWVAPYYSSVADTTDPAGRGPRVAAPDRPPRLESVVRLPFRAIALPLHIVVRGGEYAARLAGPARMQRGEQSRGAFRLLPFWSDAEQARHELGILILTNERGPVRRNGGPVPLAVRSPVGANGAPLALGDPMPAGPTDRNAGIGDGESQGAREGRQGGLHLSWSLNDHRRAGIQAEVSPLSAPLGLGTLAEYTFRPNLRTFGIGGTADRDRRAAYLAEEGRGDVYVRLRAHRFLTLGLIGGVSNISVRPGRGGPGVTQVFTEDEAPFRDRSTRVFSYGASAVLGAVDRPTEPVRGVEGGLEIRNVRSDGNANLDYVEWKGEARAYAPVFAERRVLVLRALHAGVRPSGGSDPVPFYRLPQSAGETRFLAFESGRFRDRELALAQVEYRWQLWERRLWAMGVGQWGWVAPSADRFRLDEGHGSYGGGLRLNVTPPFIYRLDVAHGNEGTQTDLTFGLIF